MKKKTELKAFLIASTILHFTFYTLHSYAATINQVIVRQQWPWSKDVKVEYSLTSVDASHPVDLTVTAYNGDTSLTIANPQESIKGDLYGITEEFGEFYIDPVAAFGSERIAMTKFKVKLTVSDSAANVNEVLYKIFCLTNSSEAVENVTRADLLNGKYGAYTTDFSSLGSGFSSPATDVLIWTGVTNDVKYKTTHLVMRKIPAKNQSFMMGSPSDEVGRENFSADTGSETQVSVRFTNDYYMAVFELTQAQYRYIDNNASPSSYVDADADYHPVEKVSYNALRGKYNEAGPSGELINWPTNSHPHEVKTGSVMDKLRKATGNAYEFDLPTSAQWEYACRAKTTTAFNNGKNLASTAYASAALDPVAWFANTEQGVTTNTTHVVGQKAPNAWGLYDMHGNVHEFCLGGYQKNSNPEGLPELVDPPGFIIEPNGYCTFRGGCANRQSVLCRSAARSADKMQIWNGNASAFVGVRLTFQVGADE